LKNFHVDERENSFDELLRVFFVRGINFLLQGFPQFLFLLLQDRKDPKENIKGLKVRGMYHYYYDKEEKSFKDRWFYILF